MKKDIKIDGSDKVSITLTNEEVVTAHSIISGNAVDEIYVMKKVGGGALFFINESRAEACMTRHKFEYMFTFTGSEIKAEFDKISKKK